jgi:hypothetical protein
MTLQVSFSDDLDRDEMSEILREIADSIEEGAISGRSAEVTWCIIREHQ